MAILNTHAADVSSAIEIRRKKNFPIWETGDNGQVSRHLDTDGDIIGK